MKKLWGTVPVLAISAFMIGTIAIERVLHVLNAGGFFVFAACLFAWWGVYVLFILWLKKRFTPKVPN